MFVKAMHAYHYQFDFCHDEEPVKTCDKCIFGARLRWICDMLRDGSGTEPAEIIQNAITGIDALFENEKYTEVIDGVTYLKGDAGDLMETFRHLMKQALATAEREDEDAEKAE